MKQKNFSKKQFKKCHPSGSIGTNLKTVDNLMFKGKNIPFINENINVVEGLKVINEKKLGIEIVQGDFKKTTGVITDG